ncbi:hypothetical protein QUF90_25170 [Desulfococcaceae bacterium HSG9]|nr:hypothetical protein [Desulfococcaceae bacterium HSG9]
MTFFKKLFGKKTIRDSTFDYTVFSKKVLTCITDALTIINSQIKPDFENSETTISSDAGQLVEASLKFKTAHQLQPDNPLLHYAYASALHCAGQIQNARKEMEKCHSAHSGFKLASMALNSWDNWRSLFTLPPWNNDKGQICKVPKSISKILQTSILLPVRECISPHAVQFIRDINDDFDNLKSFKTTKIEMMNMISPITDPQIFALFIAINKNAGKPLRVQETDCPIKPRGDWSRLRWELFCMQTAFNLVIVDKNDFVLFNVRLNMSKKMIATNKKMSAMIDDADGRNIPNLELFDAIARHRSYVKLEENLLDI